MAIYIFAAKIRTRSKGQSAPAGAAYISGELILDDRTGIKHDFRRRRPSVAHAEILTPRGAPKWATDRAQLWNAVERAEKRPDAQLARELILNVPHELSPAQRVDLVRGFLMAEFVARGMVVDFAVHLPDRKGDQRNHHAHVMLTMRVVTPDGFGKKKRLWNEGAELARWRKQWAHHVNTALEMAGVQQQVDHRSLAARGIDREPEPKLGPAATDMERRGERSRLGDARRAAAARNEQRQRLHAASTALELQARQQAERDASGPHYAGWVAPANPPDWLRLREAALTSEYLHDMQGSDLARYWQIRRQNGSLVFRNTIGCLVDEGPRILVLSGNDAEIRAMLDIAFLKGWKELAFFGSDDFKVKAAIAAQRRGFNVSAERIGREIESGPRDQVLTSPRRRQGRRLDSGLSIGEIEWASRRSGDVEQRGRTR